MMAADDGATLVAARAGLLAVAGDPADAERAFAHFRQWLQGRAWRAWHPQLRALVDEQRFGTLLDCFYRVLPFGTGGRRGPVGVGPNRFNPWTLGATVQGHVRWLRRIHGPGPLKVVIGHDVRRFEDMRGELIPDVPDPVRGLSSRDFARVAAEVYTAADFTVLLPPEGEDLSTPELGFAIRHLGAVAGLAVTASHNHPDDNGGKFFGATGGQEVPPQDEDLAREVEAVDFVDRMPLDRARASGLVVDLDPAVHAAYLDANLATLRCPQARSARVVFSPLHGTGGRTVGQALVRAGFTVDVEPSQAEPDGAFPQVPFRCPNPEVPAALSAAEQTGERLGADLALVCDPDADRIGLSVRERQHDPGATDPVRWRFCSGDEIAALVCHHVLANRPPELPGPPIVLKTAVTSSLVERVARRRGARVQADLRVGFKFIGHEMDEIERTGLFLGKPATLDDFALGAEESHGLLLSAAMRDKDATGGALALAELASVEKAQGRTLVDCLERLWQEVGYVRTTLRSAVLRGAQGRNFIERIQASLRSAPWTELAGRAVLKVVDRQDPNGPLGPLRSGTDRASRDVLVFHLEGDARITLRPSGTEPKTKIYVELCGPEGRSDAASRRTLDRACAGLADATLVAMLSRVDLRPPPWCLSASDLLSVEHKISFAEQLLPALQQRLEALAGDEDLAETDGWLDQQLRPYGPGARALLLPAVQRLCEQDRPAGAARLLARFRDEGSVRGG